MIGWDYFGNIITIDECELLYISKSNLALIPEYDQKRMRENAIKSKGKLSKYIFKCSEIYEINPYAIKW